jgi:hypothetical protein
MAMCIEFGAMNLVHEKINDDEQECRYTQQPRDEIFDHLISPSFLSSLFV